MQKESGEIDFALASDLKQGDKILIYTKNGLWNENPQRMNVQTRYLYRKHHFSCPYYMQPDIAYIIGCVVSGGKMAKYGRVKFRTKDPEMAQSYLNYTARRKIEVRQNTKETYIIDKIEFGELLKKLGLGNFSSKAEDLEIPKEIFIAKKKCVTAFLNGVFDARANVCIKDKFIRLSSPSHKFVHQLQILLLNYGVTCSVSESLPGTSRHNYFLTIYGKSLKVFRGNVGFTLPSKKRELNRAINIKVKRNNDKNRYMGEYLIDKIDTITDSRNHVYDISVPDTHSFISNGFISHNTWGEVMAMFIIATLYPNVTISLTAQTKSNAAELLKDKYEEITRQFPLLKNEILKFTKSKDDAEINFLNGSRIDVLANGQQSKGQRRNRILIDEAALVDNQTFEDALKPIVEIGRTTCGKSGIKNPEEIKQAISFYTTAGFRGSDEHQRNISMYKDMVDLKGYIVLGSSWMLGCWMGRGSDKRTILKLKKDTGAVSFARNYEERWVGASDNQLVDINKLLKTRSLTEPVFDNLDNKREIILGVDVARSASKANNKTVISVVEEHHNENGLIRSLNLVNMYMVSNQLTFTAQACFIKQVQAQYHAKIVVVDTNGLGSGLRDELLKPNINNANGERYEAWDAVNGEIRSEYSNAKPLLFALNSQNRDETKKDGRINSYAIINFIDCVETQRLKLLEERKDNGANLNDLDEVRRFVPFAQTNALVEEISNLKLKHLSSGEVTVEKVFNKIDKDRFSSLMYVLWWAMSYDNNLITDNRDLITQIAAINNIATHRTNKLGSIFR